MRIYILSGQCPSILSYSHFEERFARANHKSPGFLAPYVAGARNFADRKGLMRRTYSLQELRMFTTLGLSIQTSYPDYGAITNHPPVTYGKVIDPDDYAWGLDKHRIQTPPAGNASFYTTTTTCQEVTIVLNDQPGQGLITGYDPIAGTSTGHALNVSDPDGDHLYVYNYQVWNINGCGPDATNPGTITLNAAGDIITFKPRDNFKGRATLAFHLYDGTDKGSFIVINVDVYKNCNCWAEPCQMVVNGSFEAGTDYNRWDAASGTYLMPAMVADQTNMWQNYVEFSGPHDQVLPDGMEPLEYTTPIGGPQSIVENYTPGYCYGAFASYNTSLPAFIGGVGHPSFPVPATPIVSGVPNTRFAISGTGRNNIWSSNRYEANMTLSKPMVSGAKYNVSFRYYMSDWTYPGSNSVPAAQFTNHSLELYFSNTLFLGYLPSPSGANLISPAASGISWSGANAWQNFPAGGGTSSFIYNGSSGDEYMRIIYARSNTPGANYFLYDDVSLERDITPIITANFGLCLPGVLTATVVGPGITFQWYDGAGTSVPISGATSSTLNVTHYGTYTVVTSDGCGCAKATEFKFSPCVRFTDDIQGSPTVISGTIDASNPLPTAGASNSYYICAPLTIDVNTTFTNANVLIAPNVSITVNNSALLTINNSHLATCPGTTEMWQGINLATDWGYVHVIGGSLIEDAEHAISQYNPAGNHSLIPGRYVIKTDNAVFNRNKFAIAVGHSYDLFQDYLFRNTVFTSRDLDNYGSFVNWDRPYALKNLTAPAAIPPFDLQNNVNGYYQPLPCKDGTDPIAGIELRNVGNTTGGTTGPTSWVFDGITIGDKSDERYRNLFDNMRCGVEGYESNVYVENSSFCLMHKYVYQGSPWGGIGVFARNLYPDPQILKTELRIATGAREPRNEFYDNVSGTESYNMYKALVSQAYVATNNTTLNTIGFGQTGIAMRSNDFQQLDAEYNTVHDCVNGIYLSTDPNNAGVKGNMFVEHNYISGTTGANYSLSNTGILVDELTPGSVGLGSPYTVNISENTVRDVFNGIVLYNIQNRGVNILNNIVKLQNDAANQVQYGIFHANSSFTVTNYNDVSSSVSTNDNARGMFFSGNFSKPSVGCNNVYTIGRGFEFVTYQPNTFWSRNTMDDNLKGLVHGGAIGQQGNVYLSNGNRWLTNIGFWSLSSNRLQTYAVSSAASSSPLYVLNGASFQEDPTVNDGLPNYYAYSHTGFPTPPTPASIFYSSGSRYGTTCTTEYKPIYYYRMALQQVAQDSVNYGCHQQREAWMAQLAMYKELRSDTTLTDSSTILKSFVSTAAGSRFEWLYKIEQSVANAQDSVTDTLLAYLPTLAGTTSGSCKVKVLDCHGGDSIMAHYLEYYHLYKSYRDSTFNGTDTAMLDWLCNLCPRISGLVIYHARSLMEKLTNKVHIYDDSCPEECDDNSGGGGQGGNSGRIAQTRIIPQQYSLVPNPNDGNFTLTQLQNDENPASIKVYNILGALVHTSYIIFESNAANLHLSNLAPGMYYITVRDVSGATYKLSFVKK